MGMSCATIYIDVVVVLAIWEWNVVLKSSKHVCIRQADHSNVCSPHGMLLLIWHSPLVFNMMSNLLWNTPIPHEISAIRLYSSNMHTTVHIEELYIVTQIQSSVRYIYTGSLYHLYSYSPQLYLHLPGAASATISSNSWPARRVLRPMSVRPVAAMSKRQAESLLHIASAWDWRIGSLNIILNNGKKRSVLEVSVNCIPDAYVNRLSAELSMIPVL